MEETFVGRGLRRWHQATTPYEAREPLAGRFRAQQLRAALLLTPWMLAINMLMATAICWFAREMMHPALLLLWAGTIAGAASLGIPSWLRIRSGTFRATVSANALDRVSRNVGILGTLWAIAPAWLYPLVDTFGQKLILGVLIGMMGAGGFVLSSLPRAAIVYVVALGTGLCVGMVTAEGQVGWVLLLMG